MLVRRRGFLPLRYGQRRPLEQGKPLDVLDGRMVDELDFARPRMSTIAGRIANDLGEPAAGVMVHALRSMYVGGRRRLVPSGETLVRTDESGDYRIMGLAPGTYLVVAQTDQEW